MSSSSTDAQTLIDVVMPQMGVSVSEGTIVEWRKQVGDWVEYEEAHRRHLDRQDRHRGRRRRPPGAWPRSSSRSARRSTSASCSRAWRPTPSPARRTPPSRTARRRRARPPRPPARRPARRPRRPLPAPADRDAGRRPARSAPRAARGATRPSCMRIAAEHDVDLDQVRGHRARRARAQAGRARVRREPRGAAVEEPPLHIESPYRPDPGPEPAPAATPRAAPAPAAAAASRRLPAARRPQPLSRMRQLDRRAHEAPRSRPRRTCTTMDRGRHVARSSGAREQAGLHRAALSSRARRSTRCASTRRSTRWLGGRPAHRPHATSTSASRCRWARTA